MTASRPSLASGRLSGRRRGFTLLEVLVAMVVFGAVATALLSGYRQAMRATLLAEDYAKAAFLARQLVTELQVADSPQAGSGDFGSGFPGFRWIRTVTPGADTGFSSVELKVFFTRAGDEREYRIAAGVFRQPSGE